MVKLVDQGALRVDRPALLDDQHRHEPVGDKEQYDEHGKHTVLLALGGNRRNDGGTGSSSGGDRSVTEQSGQEAPQSVLL